MPSALPRAERSCLVRRPGRHPRDTHRCGTLRAALHGCSAPAQYTARPPITLWIVEAGEIVLHRYEYSVAGRPYRNVEATRVQDGQVHEVEVYFGGAA